MMVTNHRHDRVVGTNPTEKPLTISDAVETFGVEDVTAAFRDIREARECAATPEETR
jgi:hypothetical protein